MHLIEWRWPLVLLAGLAVIANGFYQAGSPRHFRLDDDKLKVAAAIAASVLLGYPCAIAGAYISMYVTRQGGKGVAIAFFLLLGFWGFAFLALFVFVALMGTKTFERSMFFFGSFAVIGGFFLAAVWGVWGGNPSRLLSWRFPLALVFIAIIAGLLGFTAWITRWRWSNLHPKLRIRYIAANAALALVAPAAVWFAIGAIE